MAKYNKGWSLEFDKEFVNNDWWRTGDDHPYGIDASPERVKEFIAVLIKEKEEELDQILDKEFDAGAAYGRNNP